MFVRPFQSPPGNPSPSGFLRLPGRKTPKTKISPHKNPGLLPPPLAHGLIERGKCEFKNKIKIKFKKLNVRGSWRNRLNSIQQLDQQDIPRTKCGSRSKDLTKLIDMVIA